MYCIVMNSYNWKTISNIQTHFLLILTWLSLSINAWEHASDLAALSHGRYFTRWYCIHVLMLLCLYSNNFILKYWSCFQLFPSIYLHQIGSDSSVCDPNCSMPVSLVLERGVLIKCAMPLSIQSESCLHSKQWVTD